MNEQLQAIYNQYKTVAPDVTEEMFINGYNLSGDDYLSAIDEVLKKKEPTEPTTAENIQTQTESIVPTTVMEQLQGVPQNQVDDRFQQSATSSVSDITPQPISTELPSTETASIGVNDLQPNQPITTNIATPTEQPLGDIGIAQMPTFKKPNLGAVVYPINQEEAQEKQKVIDRINIGINEQNRQIRLENQKLTPTVTETQTTNDNIKTTNDTYDGRKIVTDEKGVKYVDYGNNNLINLALMPTIKTEEQEKKEREDFLKENNLDHAKTKFEKVTLETQFGDDKYYADGTPIKDVKAYNDEVKNEIDKGNYVPIYNPKTKKYETTPQGRIRFTYARQEQVDTENKRREDLAKAGEEHNKDNARQRLGDALNSAPKYQSPLTQWGNELYKETGYLLDEKDYSNLTTDEDRARFFATKKADKELKENPNADYNSIFQKEFKEQSKEQFTPAQYENAGDTVADMFLESMNIEADKHFNKVGAKEVSDRYSGYNAEAHNKERNFLNKLKQNPAFKRQVGEWLLKEGQYGVADYKERFYINANTQNKRTALIDQIQAYTDNEDNTNSEVQNKLIEQRKNAIREQANKGNFTEVERFRNDINSSAEVINKNDENKKQRNEAFEGWKSNMTVTNQEQDRIDKLTAQANSGDGWARAKVTLINTVDKTVKGLVKDPILGVLGVVNIVAGSDRLQDVLDDAKKRQAYGSHTTDNMFNITTDYKLNGVNVKEKDGRFFSVDKNGTWSPLKLSYSDKENLQFVKTNKSFSVTGAFSDSVGQIASMTGANYIGKTAYLMTGLKGLNTVKNAINIFGKESALTKGLIGIRNFAGKTSNQGAAGWFLQTYADNFQEGKQNGMNNSQANMYALMQSAITGVLSKINPDAKFFNTSYKNLQQQLISNLAQGNRNGIIESLKSFGKDVIKHGGKEVVGENIQEFVEAIAGQGYKTLQQPFTDAKFDAMTWDDVMETAIATTLSTGGIAIGNRMMQGRNPNIIQFDGGNFDLNRLTKAEKMVMLSRLDTSSSFDDLKTNFLTNNKSVDRVERELTEIKRLSDKIPNATQYSLEANAFAVQGLYKIEQLRNSEKSADPMFKEQIQAEVTAIETKIKEVLDNDIKEQQGETETVNPNPTTETPNTETEIIKPNLSDIHSQISAMDNEYQSLDLNTDEGKNRKTELENERNALMENVSVDDIKAEAKAHAETYPQLSEEYEKAQKDLEQNPKDKTLKQKEKEAGQRLNDFANESNKFNELLKAKGDKGLFVNGNYVPFKENENEYTTTGEQTTETQLLSNFKQGDKVSRKLNDNTTINYEIIDSKKDVWKLKDEEGRITEWNSANNGGFYLTNSNNKNETKENTTAESGKQSKDKTNDTTNTSVQNEKDKTDFTDEEDLDFLNNFKEEEEITETETKSNTISHKGNEYTRHDDGTYTKPDKNGKDRKVTSPNTIKALNDLHDAENVVETKEKDGYTYKKYKDGRETITSPKGNVIEPKVKRGNKTVANANFSKRKDIIFDRETEHSLKVQSNKEINSILNNFIPTNEKEVAMMYFANGGKINPKSVNKELLGNSEKKKRRSLDEFKWVWFGKNNKDSFEVVSEKLSAESDLNLDQMELRNALIDVAMSYDSSSKIADGIVELHKKNEDPYYGWSEAEIEAQQAYEKEMYGDTEVDMPEMEYAYDENEDDFPFSATNETTVNTTTQQKNEAKAIVKFLSNKFKGLFADGQKAFDEKMENLGMAELLKNKNGTVFGLYDPKENKIYLNERNLNPKTVWHEATHFQQAILKAMAGKGNTEAKAILSQFEKLLKPFIAQLEKGKTTVTINGQDIPLKADVYRKGKNESTEAYKDRMQDEVWAFLQQEENNRLWQKNDTPFKRAVNKFKEAITNLFKSIFNIPKGKGIANMNLSELIGHTAKQLQDGKLVSDKKSNNDIRFKLEEASEVIKNNLVSIHNITEQKIKSALKMGGLAMPSIAITDANIPLTGYGEITLIGDRNLIDPKANKNNKVYSADAYTPVYPSVVYDVNQKTIESVFGDFFPKEIKDWFYSVKSEIENNGIKYLKENRHIPIAFANSKGIDVVKHRKKDVGDGIIDFVKNQKEEKGFFDALYVIKDENLHKQVTNLWIKEKGKENAEHFVTDGKLNENILRNYLHNASQWTSNDKLVDIIETKKAASDYIKENNLETEYANWVEEQYNKLGVKEKLFKGYTPSGNRSYADHTLENVVKEMKKEAKKGAGFQYGGIGIAKGLHSKNFKSVEEIKKNQGKLTDFENYEKVKNELSDEMDELYNSVSPYYKYESHRYQGFPHELKDLAKKGESDSYEKLPPELQSKVTDFVEKLINIPTTYFEAKLERAVSFNEFRAAVVPTTTSNEVKEALRNNGLEVIEYTDQQDRINKTAQASDNLGVRFQILGEKGAEALDKFDEATHRMDNLSVARQMEDAGKTAKEIRLATGWERGKDKKWRYEIEDIKLKPNSLDELYKNKELANQDITFDLVTYKKNSDGTFDVLMKKKGASKSSEFANYTNVKKFDLETIIEDKGIVEKILNNEGMDSYIGSNWEEAKEIIAEFTSFVSGGEQLSRVIDAPELFKAYPQLKDAVVVIEPNADNLGSYSVRDGQIVIEVKRHKGKFAESTLAHEIQHAIQDIEGFARGGNPETFRENENFLKRLIDEQIEFIRDEEQGNKDWVEINEKIDKLDPDADNFDDLFYKYHNELIEIENITGITGYKRTLDRLYNRLINSDGYDKYQRLAGEVESRNVQSRMNMTPEQRRETLLTETEDVAREDQIVMMDGITQAMMEDKNHTISNLTDTQLERLLRNQNLITDGKCS